MIQTLWSVEPNKWKIDLKGGNWIFFVIGIIGILNPLIIFCFITALYMKYSEHSNITLKDALIWAICTNGKIVLVLGILWFVFINFLAR
ncbi:MAG: hypothetical protein V1859_02175 [archaeon]